NKITSTGARGINIRNSENLVLRGNAITAASEGGLGMEISYSNKNTIEGNTVTTSGKWADGIGVWESYENKMNGNTITASGEGSRGIMLAWHSGDSEMKNNNVVASSTGIYLHDDNNNNLIEGNTVKGNAGIHLSLSHGVTVLNNIVDGGIALQYKGTDNNLVEGNTVSSKSYGIYIFGDENGGPSENTIKNNYVSNSDRGIVLESDANGNMLTGNTANYNGFGIFVGSVSGNKFNDNEACFNSKDFNDASVSKGKGISEQTCDTSNPIGTICAHQCAARESYCCTVGSVKGWYETDALCASASADNFIVADDCDTISECEIETKLAKFSQELIVPENQKKVNWVANFLPNSTNKTITNNDTNITESAQIFSLAKTAKTSDPNEGQSLSPYAAAYPSEKSIYKYRDSKQILWFKPEFQGPYIARWNNEKQGLEYLSAWGAEKTKTETATGEEGLNIKLSIIGSEPMEFGMPYFISPAAQATITWVGRVPQHATVELKKGPAWYTSGANMITLPLDTSYTMASDLCNDAELKMTPDDTIGVWDVKEQNYVGKSAVTCRAIIDDEKDFAIYPGQVYEITVSEDTEWEQK
ncbi:MAG: right-handed parallel beta-helix repeat-containing protein, partial [Candidatus Paceibacterota bacterium]